METGLLRNFLAETALERVIDLAERKAMRAQII